MVTRQLQRIRSLPVHEIHCGNSSRDSTVKIDLDLRLSLNLAFIFIRLVLRCFIYSGLVKLDNKFYTKGLGLEAAKGPSKSMCK